VSASTKREESKAPTREGCVLWRSTSERKPCSRFTEGLTPAEPALVLTLPAEATDLDDGLLTASEVAQLKLNADWVVLSACNTAQGYGAAVGAKPRQCRSSRKTRRTTP